MLRLPAHFYNSPCTPSCFKLLPKLCSPSPPRVTCPSTFCFLVAENGRKWQGFDDVCDTHGLLKLLTINGLHGIVGMWERADPANAPFSGERMPREMLSEGNPKPYVNRGRLLIFEIKIISGNFRFDSTHPGDRWSKCFRPPTWKVIWRARGETGLALGILILAANGMTFPSMT